MLVEMPSLPWADAFSPVDWTKVFIPETPLLEIVVRGTVVYLALFWLLRFFRRQSGGLSVSDLLVIVLIADAAQNAMAGEYRSVPDGVLLVAVILGWSFGLDWLGQCFPAFERLVHPGPVPLVRDGRMIRRNMRSELITEVELMTQLREQGIERLADVRAAYIEGDGRISVIGKDNPGESRGTPDPQTT